VVPEKVRVISPQTESSPEILSVTSTPIYLESITRNATILCEIIAPQTVRPADKQWPDVEVTVNVIREPR
jgi:hypothetical protein